MSVAGLQAAFKQFGALRIEWPGKDGKHPRYPNRGHELPGDSYLVVFTLSVCFFVYLLSDQRRQIRKTNCNKLCAWRHNMPPPHPTSGTHAAAHLQSVAYTPYACSACVMNIHDRQAVARSGRWRRNWSRQYTLCSDWAANQSGLVTLTFDLLSLTVGS